jgi:ferritin-like metal-binding protein YciE
MSRSEQKVLQYLKEARASEHALVRVLQSQIAMTPRGAYRDLLSAHLAETRDHARTLSTRIGDLEHGFNPISFAFGVAESVVGQALALSKTPIDLVRGTGGEEKVLKNAKDAAATEALEIATYTALERLAERAGDDATAELAVAIRVDEERMLERILEELPALTDAVYGADVDDDPSYDVTKTGAADAARAAADTATEAAEDAADAATKTAKGAAGDAKKAAKSTASSTSKAAKGAAATAAKTADDAADTARNGAKKAAAGAKSAAKDVQDATEQAAGAVAEAADEAQDVAAGAAKGAREGAVEGAKAAREDDAPEAAEPTTGAPADVEKPWAGYDELSVEEVQAVLLTADPDAAREVVAYERAHENRAGVLEAAERHIPA